MKLTIKPKENCRWDLVSLGEVMLRFDPGERRIWTTRNFEVSEGGGEYNVARALKRCFGLDTAIVTAFVENPVGELLRDLLYQSGVDQSLVRWVADDGVGRAARNGLNFVERGFGVRAPLGCSDRGNTAVSQLKSGDIDWHAIFEESGARWFHTGGIFAGLSGSTAELALEAMKAARASGTIVSYDLNYRESLWKSIGGKKRAQEVNRALAPFVDVMIGNVEDFSGVLGINVDETFSMRNERAEAILRKAVKTFPLTVVAATLRNSKTATQNDWGAICLHDEELFQAKTREELDIFDRVGGGDSFASGLIYGFLSAQSPQWSVDCGAAHGALAMTTPGDTSMVTLNEVKNLMSDSGARISR